MIMKGVADFGQVQACLMGIKAGLNLFIYRDSEDSTLNIRIIAQQLSCSTRTKRVIKVSNGRFFTKKHAQLWVVCAIGSAFS